jgi:hypothetical protein
MPIPLPAEISVLMEYFPPPGNWLCMSAPPGAAMNSPRTSQQFASINEATEQVPNKAIDRSTPEPP